MDTAIIILLVTLLLLVAYTIVTRDRAPGRMESAIDKNFIQFQQHIQETMQTTRKEVEASKDILTDNTLEMRKMFGEMGTTIGTLLQKQEDAQAVGESLKNLLEPPTLRGTYGEQILEEMLDRVLPEGIWQRQYPIDDNVRVDAVVKMKNIIVPIDAKFPRDDYEKFLRAENPADKKQHWKSFEEAIKRQIRSIADKYIKPELGTTPFALLFIPSDAIYYEVIAHRNQLGEASAIPDFAQQKQVVPVSPHTFYAFLNTLMLGVRNVEIMENARTLQKGLAKLERNYDLFYKKYQEMGRSVDKASEAYRIGEGHIERFRQQLDSTLTLEIPEDESSRIAEGDEP